MQAESQKYCEVHLTRIAGGKGKKNRVTDEEKKRGTAAKSVLKLQRKQNFFKPINIVEVFLVNKE